jgi:hypothetical protein
MPNINELLEGHLTLEVECIDRLYLNGYLPSLATSGGLIRFLTEHLGKPIPSPRAAGSDHPSLGGSGQALGVSAGHPLDSFPARAA